MSVCNICDQLVTQVKPIGNELQNILEKLDSQLKDSSADHADTEPPQWICDNCDLSVRNRYLIKIQEESSKQMLQMQLENEKLKNMINQLQQKGITNSISAVGKEINDSVAIKNVALAEKSILQLDNVASSMETVLPSDFANSNSRHELTDNMQATSCNTNSQLQIVTNDKSLQQSSTSLTTIICQSKYVITNDAAAADDILNKTAATDCALNVCPTHELNANNTNEASFCSSSFSSNHSNALECLTDFALNQSNDEEFILDDNAQHYKSTENIFNSTEHKNKLTSYRKYAYSSSIAQHIKSKHLGVKYKCMECNKMYRTYICLRQHYKKQHKTKQIPLAKEVIVMVLSTSSSKTRQTIIRKTIDFQKLMQKSGNMYVCNTCANDGISYASRYSESVKRHIKACHLKSQKKNKQNTAYDSVNSNSNSNSISMAIKQEQQAALIAEDLITTTDIINDIVKEENKLTEYRFDVLQNNVSTEIATGRKEFELLPQTVLGKQIAQKFFESKGCSMITEYTAAADKNVKDTITDIPTSSYKALNRTSIVGKTLENYQLKAANISDDNLKHDSESDTSIQLDFDNENTCNEETDENNHVDEMEQFSDEQLLSLSQQKSSNKTQKSSNNHIKSIKNRDSNRNMANNYYCVLCEPSEVYAHRCSIILHLKRRHIKVKYKCIECSEMNTTYQDIREHYQSQHQNKQIPSLKETRIMMLPTNSEAEQTAANISTDNYANFINYRKFYYRKMANNYYCMVCKPSKKYSNRSSLICHIKQCHIQVKYKCIECSEIYHDILEHYQSQHKTKAIPSPEEIRMMMLPSSSEDGKNYCRPKNFKKLIRKSGDLYACIICAESGKSYRKKYFTLVKYHIKSRHYEAYEEQQQKKMPLKEYKDFDEVKQQSYTNQTKPIKYEEFYREVANNYHCVLCKPSTTYSYRSSLILHIKRSHIEVKYKCTECSKMYTDYSDIRQHYKSQHKTELIPSLEKIRMMTVSSSSSSSSKTSNKIYNFKTLMRQSDNLYVCITCEEDGIKYSSKYYESVRRHIKACHYEACLKSMLQEKQNATSVPVSSNSNQEQTVADQFANDNTNVKDTTSDISSFSNCTTNVENYHHTAANISDDNLKNDSESVDFAMTVPGTSTKLDFDNLNTCNELIALPRISIKEQLKEYKDFDEVEQQSHTNQIKPIRCEDFYRKVANNYHCVICEPSKTYTNRSSMTLHIKKSHIEVKYKCTECSEMYTAYSDIRQHYKSQHKTELIPSLEEIRMMTVSSSSSSSKTRRKIYNFKTLIRQSGDLYVCITCENDGITYSSKYYESLRRHIKACHYEACLKLKLQEKQNATSGAVSSSNSSNQKQTAADQFIAEDIIAATDNVNDIIKEENKLTEYRFDEQHNNMLSETTNGLKGFEFSSQSVLGKQIEQKDFSEESCSMAKENTAANDSNVKDTTSDIPSSSNNTLENCQHTVANISDDNDENDSESVDFAMTVPGTSTTLDFDNLNTCNELIALPSISNKEQLEEYKDFDEVQQSNKMKLRSSSQQKSLNKMQESHTNQIKPIKYEEFYREVANNYHCVLCEPSTTYTYRSNMISHLRKSHIEVKYKCTECSEMYSAYSDIRQHYKSQHKTETIPSIEKIRMMTVSTSSSTIRHKIYNFKTLLRQSGDLYVCITCEENGITYSSKHNGSLRRHIKACHYEACLKPKLEEKQNATSESVSSNSNQEQTAVDQFIAEDIVAATDIVNDIIKEENKLTEYRFDGQPNNMLSETTNGLKGLEFSSQSVLGKQIEKKVFNEESCSMVKENTAANDSNVKDTTSDIPSSSNKTLENCQHTVANISDDNDENDSEFDCDELNLLASHSNNEHFVAVDESNKMKLRSSSQQKSLNKMQESHTNQLKPIKYEEFYREVANNYYCVLCESSSTYTYRSTIISHLRKSHIEVKYKCTECSEMYTAYSDIRQHYESQHKIETIPSIEKIRIMTVSSSSSQIRHKIYNFKTLLRQSGDLYVCITCEENGITYSSKHYESVRRHIKACHYEACLKPKLQENQNVTSGAVSNNSNQEQTAADQFIVEDISAATDIVNDIIKVENKLTEYRFDDQHKGFEFSSQSVLGKQIEQEVFNEESCSMAKENTAATDSNVKDTTSDIPSSSNKTLENCQHTNINISDDNLNNDSECVDFAMTVPGRSTKLDFDNLNTCNELIALPIISNKEQLEEYKDFDEVQQSNKLELLSLSQQNSLNKIQQSHTNQIKPIKYEEFYRKVANNYHCVLCEPSTIYIYRSTMISHLRKSHIEVKYKCTECSEMYTAYSDIRQHYKSQHKTGTLPSTEKIRMMTLSSSSSKIRQKIYNFKTLLRQSGDLYVCITCEENGITYSSKHYESLRRHIKACHYEACLKPKLQEKQNATSEPVSSNSNQEQTAADQFIAEDIIAATDIVNVIIKEENKLTEYRFDDQHKGFEFSSQSVLGKQIEQEVFNEESCSMAKENTAATDSNVKDTTSDIPSSSNKTLENCQHTNINISDDNLNNDSECVGFAMTVPGTSTKLDFDNLNTCNELIALPIISNKEQLEEYKDFDEVQQSNKLELLSSSQQNSLNKIQQSNTNQIKPIKYEELYRKVANNYHCVLCKPSTRYTYRSTMISHLRKSHIEVKYKCTECSEMYTAYSDIRQHYKSLHKTETLPSIEKIRMMTVSSSSSKIRHKIYNFKTLLRQSGDLYVCITCENDGITYSSKHYESLRRHIKACHYEACVKPKLQEKPNATSEPVSNQDQTAADQFIVEDIFAATDIVNDIIKEENKLTEYRFDDQHKGFELSSQYVLGKQIEPKVFSEESFAMAKENTAANDNNVKDSTSDIPSSSNKTLENCHHTVANISDDNDEIYSELDCDKQNTCNELNVLASHSNNEHFVAVDESNKLELLSLSQQKSLNKTQQSSFNHFKPIKYSELYRKLGNYYNCMLCEPSKKYNYRSSVILHLKRWHIEVKYKCTKCSEMYATYYDIRQHYQSQHKIKRIPRLKKVRMMVIPSNSKAKQKYLQKSQQSAGNLIKPIKYEEFYREIANNYYCVLCEPSETYAHRCSVILHLRKSHIEMKYKCTYCSEMYTAYPDIRQHYKTEHKNKPIPLPKQMRIMMLPSSSDAGHTAADNDNFINYRKSYKKMANNNSVESERLQQSEDIKPVQKTIIADKTLHNRRQIRSNKKYVCNLCPPYERTIKYSSSRDIMYHMKAAHSKLRKKNNKKAAKTTKNKTAAVKLQKRNKAAENNAAAVKQQTITKAEAAKTAKNKTAAVKLQKTKKAAENNAAAVKQQAIMKVEAAETAKSNAAAVKLVMPDATDQNDNEKAEKENEIAEKVSEKEENASKNKEIHSKNVQNHNKKANEGLLSARYVHKGLYTKLNNIFICQLCIPMAGKKQYSSTYRSSVCRHINYENFSKHQCTDCGKVLSTRFSLERHKRQRKHGCNYSRTLNSQLQKFFNQNLALQYKSKNLVSSVTDNVECERTVALQSEHNLGSDLSHILSLQEQNESFVLSEQQKFSDESSNAENVNEASKRGNNLETNELHNQENFNIDHEQEEAKTQEASLHKEQSLEQFKAFAVTKHDNIPKTDEPIKDKEPNNLFYNHKQKAADAKELPYKKINNMYICMLCLPLTGQPQQQYKSKCKNEIIRHINRDHFTKLNYSKYGKFFASKFRLQRRHYHMPYKKFNNMYICILCKQKQRKFQTPYQYTIICHINKNHYVKYKCKRCGKVFTSKYCLQRHYQLKSACAVAIQTEQYKVNEDYNGVKNSKDIPLSTSQESEQYKVSEDCDGVDNSKEIPLTTCQEEEKLGQHKTAAAASLLYDNNNTTSASNSKVNITLKKIQTDQANSDFALSAADNIASKAPNANNYFTKTNNKVSFKQPENDATISCAVHQKPQRFRTKSHKKVGNLLVCMLCRPLAGDTAFTTTCYEAIRRHRNKVHYENYKCTDCGKSFASKFNLNRHKQYENACAKYIVHNNCSNDTDKTVSANDSAAAVPLSEFDVFKQELKDGSTAAQEISVNNLNITDSMIFIKEEKQLNDDYELPAQLDKNVAGLHNEECSIVNSGSIKDQLSKYHQYFRQNSYSTGEHDVQLKEAGKMSLTEHFKDPLTENIKNELTENIDDPLTEDIEIALTEDIEEFQFITSPTACELTSDNVANSVSRNFEEIDGKYMCSPCSDAGTTNIFNNKQSLLKHTKETHFNVSKNIKKNNASLHEEIASAIKNVNSKYVCTLCLTNGNNRQYTSFDLKAIKRHVLHRHFQTNKCHHCAKNFSNKSNLKRHLDQKIPCTVAKTSCTLEKNLIKDLEQEKIHQCTTCGEIFTKKFYLKRHRSMICNK